VRLGCRGSSRIDGRVPLNANLALKRPRVLGQESSNRRNTKAAGAAELLSPCLSSNA
jgi:hypothetical protein